MVTISYTDTKNHVDENSFIGNSAEFKIQRSQRAGDKQTDKGQSSHILVFDQVLLTEKKQAKLHDYFHDILIACLLSALHFAVLDFGRLECVFYRDN